MIKSGHVYIIDDDESMRISFSRMLSEVGYTVNHYQSGISFLEESLPISPAVILLDMQMPDMTGVQLQQKLLDLGRRTPIIFISGQSHPSQIVAGLKNGAIDFLFKPFNLEDLLVAVSDALELDKRRLIRLTKELDAKKCFRTLTPREKEVCELLVKGLLNKEAAVKLGIVDATIKVHKARVMEKMRADSLQDLVRIYLEAGLGND
ncbi:two component transcriptional regulator, LuxR family [Polynucleobacter meluiroseus]|uniref:Two component transcriptional regulator, LuxR family n=1 Tax=Polynucleobacter meluiroseus TaxID=1938814 RepID=A0A240DWX0_9BURK|nr:response regulator [Polynucleobacter meluiroseus]SNX27689.1 two component transcriptional regulator, LuxR family [Polynucleobacter meluiroseus]